MMLFKVVACFFCAVTYCQAATTEEPVEHGCSRFVYEYKLMERLLKLEMEVASLREKLSQAEQYIANITQSVVVNVGLLRDVTVQIGEKVKFDRVLVNIGNAYDVSEGVFEAPVSGIYVFSVSICLNEKQWMAIKMFHDGAEAAYFFIGDSAWEDCSSAVSTLLVRAGGKLWLERVSGTSSLLHEMYGWNSFTANLIAASRD